MLNNFYAGPNTDKESINSDFEIGITTTQEIMELILKLDDTISSGPSSMPTKLLKIAAHVVVLVFTNLINNYEGIFFDKKIK